MQSAGPCMRELVPTGAHAAPPASPPQERAAERRLLAAHGAQEARDVHVRLHVLDRSARLAFLPAFHLEYEQGEAFNAHGERVPARYEALISGTGAFVGRAGLFQREI